MIVYIIFTRVLSSILSIGWNVYNKAYVELSGGWLLGNRIPREGTLFVGLSAGIPLVKW